MTKTTQFTIGSEVRCSDGVCGKLSRVIVDPLARAVTHLVVEPSQGNHVGRIVPLDLVGETAAEIEIHCTTAELEKPAPAEQTHFLQDGDSHPGSHRRPAAASPPGLGGGAARCWVTRRWGGSLAR